MKDRGWFKMYRNIFEWSWLSDVYVFKFYVLCIADANTEDTMWKNHKIKRGQLLASTGYLEGRFKMSHNSIQRCIKALEKSGHIKVKYIKGGPKIITIVNYEAYQGLPSEGNLQGNLQGNNPRRNKNSVGYANATHTEEEESDDFFV